MLTNRDHERAAAALRDAFGARVIAHAPEAPLFSVPIDATFADGDEVFPGAFAIALPGGKTAGEVALHLRAQKAAVVGDALIGAPAGALSLLPSDKLEDAHAFPFTLRRLWALQLQTLLLCDGQPLFSNADAAIGELLERVAGAEINRINVNDLAYQRVVRKAPQYAFDFSEIGLLIGARKLGYCIVKLPPGTAVCPLHWHVQAEEVFYVISGAPSIRTTRGTIACRAGDVIAFPPGERGAHQLRNDSGEPCEVMLAGMEEDAVQFEACFYPDSQKVGLYTTQGRLRMVRSSPDLDYFYGE